MKYFKVVDPRGHNGLVYKKGYNEDPLPFNLSGDCEAGGIYFASKDIFHFWGYGTKVYEVKPVGDIYENPGHPKKYKAHAVNLKYIGKISDVKTVKYLIESGADINKGGSWALQTAAEHGHLDVVRFLAEHGVDIHDDEDRALCVAYYCGHLGVAKYLVENGANLHALVTLTADHSIGDVGEVVQATGATVTSYSGFSCLGYSKG